MINYELITKKVNIHLTKEQKKTIKDCCDILLNIRSIGRGYELEWVKTENGEKYSLEMLKDTIYLLHDVENILSIE